MTAPKDDKAIKPKKPRSTHKKPSWLLFADGSLPDSPLTFTQYCQEKLGTDMPVGANRTRWFAQLKQEMELQHWDYEDLVRTVQYIRTEGIAVRYPHGVLHYVKAAKQAVVETSVSDLHTKVAEALGKETDPVWMRRLSLAQGTALEMVYTNWRKERDGM